MRKFTISLCLLCIAAANIQAQQLPAIQKESVLAPNRKMIDGSTNEWQNQFKAYNKNIRIFYTIANDNNNLYVIIKADDRVTIEKILEGGVTFTIENPGENKKAVPVSITSPIIPLKNVIAILNPLRDTSIKIKDALPGMNKGLEDNSKEIGVTGIKDIPDSLISVYDNHGIKTFSLFTEARAYVYELAAPLKYFTNAQDIHYKIRLNGVGNAGYSFTVNGKAMSMTSPEVMENMMQWAARGDRASIENLQKVSPTDLSGTYILAK